MTAGAPAASSASSGCSPLPSTSTRAAPADARPRPARHQAALPHSAAGTASASRRRCPALLAGGGVDTEIDPVALHHYLSWHSVVPPPRTILKGVRKLAPATVMIVEPDGTERDRDLLARPLHARLAPSERDWGARMGRGVLDALETAVERRMVADVPVGVLLVRRARLEPDRRAARARRARGPRRRSASASTTWASARATNSATRRDRAGVRDRPPQDPRRRPTGCSRRWTGRSGR